MRRGWVVGFTTLDTGRSEITQEDYSRAWRVLFSLNNGVNYGLPIPFGRKRDAEACAKVLATKITSPEKLSGPELIEQFAAIGGSLQETVNHLVATCCQW